MAKFVIETSVFAEIFNRSLLKKNSVKWQVLLLKPPISRNFKSQFTQKILFDVLRFIPRLNLNWTRFSPQVYDFWTFFFRKKNPTSWTSCSRRSNTRKCSKLWLRRSTTQIWRPRIRQQQSPMRPISSGSLCHSPRPRPRRRGRRMLWPRPRHHRSCLARKCWAPSFLFSTSHQGELPFLYCNSTKLL